MEATNVLPLLKARLGISATARDTYLTAIINSVLTELQDEKGIALDDTNARHLMFVVDYSSWIYESKGEAGGMPRHLQFGMHNLLMHNGGDLVV